MHPSLGALSARRSPLTAIVFVALVGAFAGLVAAGYEHAVSEVALKRLFEAPLVVQAIVPLSGLIVSFLLLRSLPGRSSLTPIDDYIASVGHGRLIDHTRAPAQIAACAVTLASGCALGLEAPAVYAGGAIGSAAARR